MMNRTAAPQIGPIGAVFMAFRFCGRGGLGGLLEAAAQEREGAEAEGGEGGGLGHGLAGDGQRAPQY